MKLLGKRLRDVMPFLVALAILLGQTSALAGLAPLVRPGTACELPHEGARLFFQPDRENQRVGAVLQIDKARDAILVSLSGGCCPAEHVAGPKLEARRIVVFGTGSHAGWIGDLQD